MDAPKPPQPPLEVPRGLALKPATAAPILVSEAEEGETLSDKALPSLKGKVVVSTSSVLPSDKEMDMLEQGNVDEAGELCLLVFELFSTCFMPS